MKKSFIPLTAFLALAILLGIGLKLDPRDVPSPLVNKLAPEFTLNRLDNPQQQFSSKSMLGKVWLLNVWASWCAACREEHAMLIEISKSKAVPIVGLNYKEIRGDGNIDSNKLSVEAEQKLARQRANDWLDKRGNPYDLVVLDLDGQVGIDYGVYGVPETYVIDKNGRIRLKITGSISPDSLTRAIQPLIKELNK